MPEEMMRYIRLLTIIFICNSLFAYNYENFWVLKNGDQGYVFNFDKGGSFGIYTVIPEYSDAMNKHVSYYDRGRCIYHGNNIIETFFYRDGEGKIFEFYGKREQVGGNLILSGNIRTTQVELELIPFSGNLIISDITIFKSKE